MNRRTIIEQCLLDAKEGYLVDESVMSWIKGKAAGAKQAAKNLNTSVKNGIKNVKAGYKNTLGKMAGGATQAAASQEADDIMASRDEYGSVKDAAQQAEQDQLNYEEKVNRAKNIKKAGIARQKAEAKSAKLLQKTAAKALSAIEEFKNAGGTIKHGRTNAMNSIIKALTQAAGVNDTPAQETEVAQEQAPNNPNEFSADVFNNAPKTKLKKQKATAKKPIIKKPNTANITGGDAVDNAISNSTYTSEWEETVNHGVAAVHENYMLVNSPGQIKLLNSIR